MLHIVPLADLLAREGNIFRQKRAVGGSQRTKSTTCSQNQVHGYLANSRQHQVSRVVVPTYASPRASAAERMAGESDS